jgi:energy-converting hydrogenase Eha subunit E
MNRKRVSAGLYLLALLVFLLPFLSVSCGSRQVYSLSGTDLARGYDFGAKVGSIEALGVHGGLLPPDPWTLLTWLLLPALGLAALWLGDRRDPRIAPASMMAIGLLGALRLLALLNQVRSADGAEAAQSIGIVRVDMSYGFWLALLTFVAIAAWGALWLRQWMRGAGVTGVSGLLRSPG